MLGARAGGRRGGRPNTDSELDPGRDSVTVSLARAPYKLVTPAGRPIESRHDFQSRISFWGEPQTSQQFDVWPLSWPPRLARGPAARAIRGSWKPRMGLRCCSCYPPPSQNVFAVPKISSLEPSAQPATGTGAFPHKISASDTRVGMTGPHLSR